MSPRLPSRPALYAAFDRFPSSKGAATHIDRAARALFSHCGGGTLCVLGDASLPAWQPEGPIDIVRSRGPAPHLLDRAGRFGDFVAAHAARMRATLRIVQFRDPWGGRPLLAAGRRWAAVYEVNGLPSIELPERYPLLSARTLDKLRALEADCLRQADAIVVPSRTIAQRVIADGAARDRTVVIPNGADPLDAQAMPTARPDVAGSCTDPHAIGAGARRFAYVGATQRWQGLPTLLRAFARLDDLPDSRLVLALAAGPQGARGLQALADRLGIGARCDWHFDIGRDAVARLLAGACCSVAPLAPTARNLDQGCCPLKVLESMAVGTPVIASDLACVREIVTDGVDGLLVRPNRPDELARAMRTLVERPQLRVQLGAAARERIATRLSWRHAHDRLADVYRSLGLG